MNPVELAKTIYLGDRAVKAICIDGWARTVKIQIDVISRIRSQNGQWDFYTAEDIADGFLVLTGVAALIFDPPGTIPSDYVVDFQVGAVREQFHRIQDSIDVCGCGRSPEGKSCHPRLCRGFLS